MSLCRIDFETRSDVNLKTCGTYNYFASPHFKALMAAYSIDDGPIRDWTHTQPCPADLREHIEKGGRIRAFNAGFERGCFTQLAKREGWPMPDIWAFECSAATAAAMGLPRKLKDLGEALDLKIQKDKAGDALIRKFSIPRKPRKEENPDGVYWNEPEDFPEDFARFLEYCRGDVLTEAEADRRMVPLSDAEQKFYTLTEIKNDRGIRIDIASAYSALALAEKAKRVLDREMRSLTGYGVTQPAKLVEWVQSQGVVLDNARKADIESLLELDDLPANVRRALEIRQEGGKTSVSKLNAMIKRAGADGRARGTGIYHAASTGREQSVGINTSNLPRPRREYDEAHPDTQLLFEAIRSEDPVYLQLLYGEKLGRPLHLLSDSLRGFIWAGPGNELVQADYSGIEGAVIAWTSREDWKVAEMHRIIADPVNVPDLYRQTAANIMNTTTDVVTKKHPLRQSVGKVSELALGFGGGVAAFHSMSLNYGVKLAPLFAPVWEVASEERREKAVKRYEANLKRGKEKTDVLSREAWIACELIKVGWRATNPAIASGWRAREEAVREAIRNPGQTFKALKFSYKVALGYLWCQLPSGRCLAYASPKLRDQVWAETLLPDGTWCDAEVMDRIEAERLALRGIVRIKGATSPAITALGVSKSGKMVREFLYGGILAENDTQAVARDLLVNGMWKAEAAGYPIIATVYDEIIAEVRRGSKILSEFEKLICELPAWALGGDGELDLPLTAGGWVGKRYRKE
jgi:DNA polymerase